MRARYIQRTRLYVCRRYAVCTLLVLSYFLLLNVFCGNKVILLRCNTFSPFFLITVCPVVLWVLFYFNVTAVVSVLVYSLQLPQDIDLD
jgi:uncharacterized membrane protein